MLVYSYKAGFAGREVIMKKTSASVFIIVVIAVMSLLGRYVTFRPSDKREEIDNPRDYFESLEIGDVDMDLSGGYYLVTGKSNRKKADVSFTLKDGWHLEGLYVYRQDKPADSAFYNPYSSRMKSFFGDRSKAEKAEDFDGIPTGEITTYYYFDITNPEEGLKGTLYAVVEKYDTLTVCFEDAIPGETVIKFKAGTYSQREMQYVSPDFEYDPEISGSRDYFSSAEEFCEKFYDGHNSGLILKEGESLYTIDGNTVTIKIGKEYALPEIELINGGEKTWLEYTNG